MGTPDKTEWPEGHRLAAAIQFRFPECPKIPLSSVITRASQQGLHLIAELLHYDPDKRPSAQQSQRYQYFMNVKNGASASIRPQPNNALTSGRLSIMEMESMDNNSLMNRFNLNPKFSSNSDLNELNSLLSNSRMSQNNDKPMIIDTNAGKKFQSNFNILNDMFTNMKTDTNNNDKGALDKNLHGEVILPAIDSAPRKPEESERSNEKEKINDVFINLLKDNKEPMDYNSTYNSSTSFFLHEPKASAAKPRSKIDSGMSFKMLSKVGRDNSFDEGFFDSLNTKKKANAVVRDWDDGMEDDELASILGWVSIIIIFTKY